MDIRPSTEADADRIVDLRMLAFGMKAADRARSRADVLRAEYRVAEVDGMVQACARILRFAHFFGGRAVPAAGIASVAVSAEARGKGIGRALMEEVLREVRGDGIPTSSLYPATAVLYRQVGYGFGGTRTQWKSSLRDIRVDDRIAVEPLLDDDLEEVERLYERFAASSNGLVQRSREHWTQRVLSSAWDDEPHYRFVVREDGAITGWVVYRTQSQRDEWRFEMACRDLFWSTAAAGRALLALGALHRSTGSKMSWYGPPVDPTTELQPEDHIELDHSYRWMLRLTDVRGALEARGYHPTVAGGVSIGVIDPLLPDNEGPWRVEVEGGRAKVAPAERAEATAGVAAWASLWSGLTHPRDAVRLGHLEATEDALQVLESIFAGPVPWSADFY